MKTENGTQIIRQFNITSKYKGYYFVLDAIEIASSKQNETLYITKDIYPIIAKKYNTTTYSVEKDIRTIIEKCWINNKQLLERIAGCKLDYCPTNSEFIDYMTYYMNGTV